MGFVYKVLRCASLCIRGGRTKDDRREHDRIHMTTGDKHAHAMCRYYESHTPAAVKPLGVFSAVSEQQGTRSDIELLGGQRLLAPAAQRLDRQHQ